MKLLKYFKKIILPIEFLCLFIYSITFFSLFNENDQCDFIKNNGNKCKRSKIGYFQYHNYNNLIILSYCKKHQKENQNCLNKWRYNSD